MSGGNTNELSREIVDALNKLHIDESHYQKYIATNWADCDSLLQEEETECSQEDDMSWQAEGEKYKERCDSILRIYKEHPDWFEDVTKEVSLVFGAIPDEFPFQSILSPYNIFIGPNDDLSANEGLYIIQKTTVVEETVAEFPGGEEALFKFLSTNVKYPKHDKELGIQGKVTVRFVVDTDGSIGDVTIQRGVSPTIDAEAIRVVKLLPRFKPATQNKKPVNSWFSMPIIFCL